MRDGGEQPGRPVIFLSHSAKHREIPGDERLMYAREVLDLIDQALQTAGFDTWMDRDRLHPGDRWNAGIHVALNTCAGGVVLLDPVVMVESDWVLQEATVLASRYAASPGFRLVPVLIGGARPEALLTGRWAHLRLSDIQPARNNPSAVLEDLMHQAELLAQQVTSAFDGLASVACEPQVRWWVDEIAAPLKDLASQASHRLDAAAEVLGMDRTEWGSEGERVDRLAFALVDSEPELIPDAVEMLAPLYGGRADPVGDRLADLVMPLWVRLETASGVTRGLRRDPEERRVFITACDRELAIDIINRAICFSPKFRLAGGTGEFGENPEQLLESYSREIRKTLYRFNLGPNAPPALIREKLDGADPPPCALISAEGLDEAEISSLLDQLRDRFPGVVLVLVSSRPELGRTLPPPEPSIVEPPLTAGEVDAAMIFRYRILELAGRERSADEPVAT